MAISSARYTDLYDYARTAEQIDYDLMGQADRLANRLNYFEATCREGGFQVSSDSLGPAMRSYSVRALPVDQHVRKVGEDFQRADGAWGSSLWLPGWLPGWWHEATSWAERFGDWWAWLGGLAFAPAYLVMTMPHGTKYMHEIIIRGPALAREILGLSPNLGHIKLANLTSHLWKNALNVGPWFLVGAAIASAEQWMKDIESYQGDLVGMINALMIDTEVIVATMGLGWVAATGISYVIFHGVVIAGVGIGGVAVGSTLAPFLVTGGIVLGIGLLADKFLLEPFMKSEFRLDAIEWLTDKEYDLVNFLDARVDEFLGRDMQPMPVVGPIPMPRPTPSRPPSPVPPARPVEGLGKIEPSPFAELVRKAKIARAEDVPLSVSRNVNTPNPPENFTPYYRGSSDTSKSNCTWYAATALATYTGGKIDLHGVHGDYRMGDAVNWPVQAMNAKNNVDHPLHGFVTDVDKKPAAGTVITFDPKKGGAGDVGHVAWVEEANVVMGKDNKKYWELVISEENYGGGNWKGATKITTGDETVKRWRRTVTYPVSENDGSEAVTDGIRFIHWDPGYKPE